MQLSDSRKFYYPDTNDPNAIVFDGPTNADSRKTPDKIPDSPPRAGGQDYDYGEGRATPEKTLDNPPRSGGQDYDYGEGKLDLKFGNSDEDC